MDFEGKVLQILPPTKGTSARGEWQRQEVIFEMTQEFSRKVAVTFFNKPADVEKLRVGESYIVSVNVESREYNGRWYTDVREWRIQPLQQQAAAPAADLPPLSEEPSYASGNTPVDDMPF
ncbi:MAG: DUF3127 domain-containing protein [Alistipes sp.]|nr:DUF3127 domain-containing protein [Alistipes sp.]